MNLSAGPLAAVPVRNLLPAIPGGKQLGELLLGSLGDVGPVAQCSVPSCATRSDDRPVTPPVGRHPPRDFVLGFLGVSLSVQLQKAAAAVEVPK